jgi:4-amino-4-deoxy-L-arabinose transferase-like glycosyltransferase
MQNAMNSGCTINAAASAASEAPPPQAKWPYLEVGIVAAIFFYLHLYRFPFLPIWHWGDQSVFLDHAERMLDGAVLYRDLFQLNLPGTEYLYYWLFLCFGVRLWIAPLIVFVALTASTLLVYSLARAVLRGWAALLPVAAFLVICQRISMDGTHHLYSTLLVFAAVSLVVRARNTLWLCGAGALLGLATLFTSGRGVSVAAGVCVFFIWKFRDWRKASQSIAALLLPLIAAVSAALTYLATTVAPRALFESLVVFPMHYFSAGRFNTPAMFFAELNSALPLRPHSVLFVGLWLATKATVPLLFIAFIARRLLFKPIERRGSRSNQALVLYFFAGSFELLAQAGSLSQARLNCAAAFAYILGAAMLHDSGKRRLIGAALAITGLIGLAEVTAAVIHPVEKFDSPRGSVVFLRGERYEMVAWLFRNAHPGDRLFGDPDLNFVLGLANPAEVQWVEYDAFTRPEQVSKLLIALDRYPTRFFIWDDVMDRSGPGDNLQPLRVYLKEHYHLALHFSGGAEVLVENDFFPR